MFRSVCRRDPMLLRILLWFQIALHYLVEDCEGMAQVQRYVGSMMLITRPCAASAAGAWKSRNMLNYSLRESFAGTDSNAMALAAKQLGLLRSRPVQLMLATIIYVGNFSLRALVAEKIIHQVPTD